jgi:hypothetical protein
VDGAVEDGAGTDRRRQGEAPTDVALAPAEDGRVDREDEGLVARRGRALDHLPHQAAVAPGVDLEPQTAGGRGGAHLLDRAGAERRERVGQAGPLGGAGHGQLALGVGDAGEPGRGQGERVGGRPAQDRCADVDVADGAQDAGPERGAGEGVLVGGEAALVLGPAVDVVEHAAGQAALGDPAQVGHRGGLGQPTLDRVGLGPLEADHRSQRRRHLPQRGLGGHGVPRGS